MATIKDIQIESAVDSADPSRNSPEVFEQHYCNKCVFMYEK